MNSCGNFPRSPSQGARSEAIATERGANPVTLEAISKLLDTKLDPIAKSVKTITDDLSAFKKKMNGLNIRSY